MKTKTVKTIVLTVLLLGGTSILFSSGIPQAQEKVTICHKKADGTTVTLKVSPFSVSAHMSHGDSMGACGQ